MPQFKYRAYDRQGKLITGVMRADNVPAVSAFLAGQSHIPVAITESGDLSLSFNIFRPKVSLRDLMLFARQMWTLQKAGVPIEASLTAMREQVEKEYFKKVLSAVIKDIQGGASLSVAFSRHPDVFDVLFVNMVSAGEASGKLDEVLLNLAEMCEFEQGTREKIKAATRYPLIIFCTLVIAFFVIVMFVIPPFTNLYGHYGSSLPVPTLILLFINSALRHYWYLVLLLAGGLVFAFKSYVNTKLGRYQWDYLMIKMPPIGSLFFNLSMSRFARILSQLLGSGVPILQSLQLVADTVGNTVIQKAIVSLQKSVNEGKGMSETMKHSGFFAPIVVQMVSIGEQTGKTEELLSHIAGYYEDQANAIIKNLSSLIEPALIFFLGGMVLLLALGVFLPSWNLVNVVK